MPLYPTIGDAFIMDYSSVDLTFSLVAAQTPHEEDSFGSDYGYMMRDAGAGDMILLSSNFEWEETIQIPAGKDIVLDGAAQPLKETVTGRG